MLKLFKRLFAVFFLNKKNEDVPLLSGQGEENKSESPSAVPITVEEVKERIEAAFIPPLVEFGKINNLNITEAKTMLSQEWNKPKKKNIVRFTHDRRLPRNYEKIKLLHKRINELKIIFINS